MLSPQSHCQTGHGGELSILCFLLTLTDYSPSETHVSEQDSPAFLAHCHPQAPLQVPGHFRVHGRGFFQPLAPLSGALALLSRPYNRTLHERLAPSVCCWRWPLPASCLWALLLAPHSACWTTPGLSSCLFPAASRLLGDLTVSHALIILATPKLSS